MVDDDAYGDGTAAKISGGMKVKSQMGLDVDRERDRERSEIYALQDEVDAVSKALEESLSKDPLDEDSSFSFVDVTDWLMAKPLSLAFVLIGFLCFFVSFTAMAVVTSQKCALGSPLVVEIQEQCSEAADLVNMMVWLGMGMVLIGWLLKK